MQQESSKWWPPSHTIACPKCGHVAPWQPQPIATVVTCGYRKLTGASQLESKDGPWKPQYHWQIYSAGETAWLERYHVDGPDDQVTEPCGRIFTVMAVKPLRAATTAPTESPLLP